MTAQVRSSPVRPIGILAGNGGLPAEIAHAVRAGGGSAVIVAIDGEVDCDLEGFPLTRVGWGEIGRILATFRNAGCQELVIVGGVTRPDIARLRPDFGLIANLPALLRLVMAGGDDGVLRSIVRFFEAKGFTVVSPGAVAPRLIVGAGCAGAHAPSPQDGQDMLLGSSIVRALGRYDIGQAVIVNHGRIEAIEAAEGTDRMMTRFACARRAVPVAAGSRRTGGVLVKRPKPAQEMRVDLPTIGPNTVMRAAEAELAGIAVLAGETLIAARRDVIAAADASGLFVYGFREGDAPLRKATAQPWDKVTARALGSRMPGRGEIADAGLGASALACLAVLSQAGAAVISRGYVLGLEPDGQVAPLLARVAHLKQWGEGRWRKRTGVGVLGEAVLPDVAMVEAAAHLRALAMMNPRARDLTGEVIAAADRAGLVLMALTPAGTTSAGRAP